MLGQDHSDTHTLSPAGGNHRSAKKRDIDQVHADTVGAATGNHLFGLAHHLVGQPMATTHYHPPQYSQPHNPQHNNQQQPIQIKRGRGRPPMGHHNYDENAVAAMLANVPDAAQNPFIASPMRIAVAPALGPGIALLTPSRPNTPRPANGAGNATGGMAGAPNTPGGTPKADKGLRHFSARVSAKVEQKGCTTYNEVADELVQEIGREMGVVEKYDHKNIRRRVYDALNVLMAIDIIRKDKKEIRWLGLPSDASQDVKMLEAERAACEKRLAEKRRVMGELVQRHVALKSLIARNQRLEAQSAHKPPARLIIPDAPAGGSTAGNAGATSTTSNDRLYLPFILVNAPKDCRVHCEMLEDRTQYFFEFDAPFFINEDIELLKLMGLDTVGVEEAAQWLPADLLEHMPYNNNTNNSGGGKRQPVGGSVRPRRLATFAASTNQPVVPQRPMSDTHFPYHTLTTGTAQPQAHNNLSKRFRETLSSFADFGSSPVI